MQVRACVVVVIWAGAIVAAGAAAAQTAGQPKRAASKPAPPVVFADENDPTLPRRGSEEDCRAWRAEKAISRRSCSAKRTRISTSSSTS